MIKESFVSFIPSKNNENFKVVIGNCGKWENIQFIELEYTDSGIVIHYYNYNCLDYQARTKEKFRKFQSESFILECELRFVTSNGNELLDTVMNSFNKQGCDFIHEQDCSCIACSLIKDKYCYRTDTINKVREKFELA